MTHLIKLTNNNSFEIVDYFDGIAYKFQPDVPVNVSLEAMQHIFGVDFPEDEAVLKSASFRDMVFAKVSRRWGWNSHDQAKLAANRKILNHIVFAPVIMQQVELVSKPADLAEPREQKPTVKGGKFKPRADEAEETSEEEVA